MSRNLLELQKGVIYGPVASRRLGASLGLNILPAGYKACPFNCAYCQYGFTSPAGFCSVSDSKDMPQTDEIIAALNKALDKFPDVAYITFSGNGEPTLHPDFSDIVDEVKKIRDVKAPHAQMAILSNSALVSQESIREALMKLDRRFMKLDCGDEKTFRKFNRPHKDISYQEIVDGLEKLNEIHIQALFAGGAGGNFNDRHIENWIKKIGEIKPIECHIYSTDRPTADGRLTLVGHDDLVKIKLKAEKEVGIPVNVF